MKKYLKKICLFALIISSIGFVYAQQEEIEKSTSTYIDAASIAASTEFSLGVRSFHQGYYNKALVNFEKAVSLKPSDPLYRLWLGFAHFYTGLDDMALGQWETLLYEEDSLGGSWLKSKIEALNFRHSPYFTQEFTEDSWIERSRIEEPISLKSQFVKPTSVKADVLSSDIFVVSYGSNAIVRYDLNGDITNTFKGGIVPFSAPYDILPLADGRFFVSEFGSNRISLMSERGNRLNFFGNTPEQGGLSGPQFIESDNNGNLFVSDSGNKRIVKYSYEGNFLVEIGKPSPFFAGLKDPSGLAISRKEIFVADRKDSAIHVFDHSGNFIKTISSEKLNMPEGLTLYQNKYLLVANGDELLMLNIEDESLILLSDVNKKAKRLFKSAFDKNKTLILVDNGTNSISYLSRLSDIYSGLATDIRRVNTQEWPKVSIEVVVKSHSGNNIMGLKENNFLLLENGLAPKVNTFGSRFDLKKFPAIGSINRLNGALIVESSMEGLMMESMYTKGINDLYQDITAKGNLNFFWASNLPIAEENINNANDAVLTYRRKSASLASNEWRFDTALRLAANSLVPLKQNYNQAIFFLTTGLDNTKYEQYQITELINYLANNNIAFYPIYLDYRYSNKNYDYIAEKTGGISSYIYRPEGLSSLIDIEQRRDSGIYYIDYITQITERQEYIYQNIDLEVILDKESGKTKSGFFPPLQSINSKK